jgi:hypothetical protein|tara:strand:- start:298 stop:498 length:201 start_codon:yes stop_codon:yes gene_type:complete
MNRIKFRGLIPAVNRYIKSKSIPELIAELIAFGFLAPLAITGILFMLIGLITGQVDPSGVTFGIYG